MSTADNLGENSNVLNGEDLSRLVGLSNFAMVNYDGHQFRVTVDGDDSMLFFSATGLDDGEFMSFLCMRANGDMRNMKGCDVSWVRAFLNGYS